METKTILFDFKEMCILNTAGGTRESENKKRGTKTAPQISDHQCFLVVFSVCVIVSSQVFDEEDRDFSVSIFHN